MGCGWIWDIRENGCTVVGRVGSWGEALRSAGGSRGKWKGRFLVLGFSSHWEHGVWLERKCDARP